MNDTGRQGGSGILYRPEPWHGVEMSVRERLEEAIAEGCVVSIDREVFEEQDEIGYVVAVGEELVLWLRISDGIRFDGFSVLRIEDLSQVDVPYEHDAFVASALRLRGEVVPAPPEIFLDAWSAALRAAGPLFPVLTLHTEADGLGLCRIGCLRGVDDEALKLLELDPDADWAEEPSRVAIETLTRVDLGGAYEEALLLVGGAPPVRALRIVE